MATGTLGANVQRVTIGAHVLTLVVVLTVIAVVLGMVRVPLWQVMGLVQGIIREVKVLALGLIKTHIA